MEIASRREVIAGSGVGAVRPARAARSASAWWVLVRARVFLLRRMVAHDVRARFAGTTIGIAWFLLQPLIMLGVYTVVFQQIYRAGPVAGGYGFAPFAFCGLWPWMAFQEGTMRAVTAVVDNAGIVKKVSFPSELFVVSAVVSSAIVQGAAFIVFLVVFVGVEAPARLFGLPWLVVPVVLQLAFAAGLGMLLACAHVFVRDVAQITAAVMSVWFFLTPIVYAESMVPRGLLPLLQWNPMTPIVRCYRAVALGSDPGPLTGVLFSAVVAALLLQLGRSAFRRCRPFFADHL